MVHVHVRGLLVVVVVATAEEAADGVNQHVADCPQGIEGQGADAAEQCHGEAVEPEARELARDHEVGAVGHHQ